MPGPWLFLANISMLVTTLQRLPWPLYYNGYDSRCTLASRVVILHGYNSRRSSTQNAGSFKDIMSCMMHVQVAVANSKTDTVIDTISLLLRRDYGGQGVASDVRTTRTIRWAYVY